MIEKRYEIRKGKYGIYFYDLDLKCDMTLDDILEQMNNVKRCDMCGKDVNQVYCVKCMDNSAHLNRQEFSKKLKQVPE